MLDKNHLKYLVDNYRFYLLKQEAELYPNVQEFIKFMEDSDLTKAQLTDIYYKTHKLK